MAGRARPPPRSQALGMDRHDDDRRAPGRIPRSSVSHMNRIAADEPDEVGITPKPIRFYWHGRAYDAEVSRSNVRIDRLLRHAAVVKDFSGEYGRYWLADPCTMALHEGLQGARLVEDAAAKADRMARRRAKAALVEEAGAGRRTR